MEDHLELKQENILLRKQLETLKEEITQLTIASQQLEVIISHVPIVLYIIDKNGKFILSEGAGLKDLGLKPGQVIGLSVFDVYANFPEVIKAQKESLEGIQSHYLFKLTGQQNIENTKTLDEIYYDVWVKPVFDSLGNIEGAMGIGHNTTILRRAESKLAESETRYRTLINDAPLGILVIQKGICKFANPEFLSMFGYEKQEEIYDTLSENLLAPEVRSELIDRSRRRELGEEVIASYETKGLKKDGTIFPIQVEARRILFNDTLSILIYFKDITLVKKLAKDKEMLQEQLRLSQKLESLGIVAGGVAHDFNNILLGIMGYTSLLETNISEDNESRKYLKEIFKISEEARTLTKQMLAYTGKTILNQETVSLNDVIEDMKKLITVSINKSISIQYNLNPKISLIKADINQLKQVILNLVINASESFQTKNNGTITIKTGKEYISERSKGDGFPIFDLELGNYSYIEIEDNGSGIHDKDMSQIFDPFYSTKFTGRGLGLSVVQGIVKAHKGAIKVFSELQKGSRFKILFPVTGDERTEMIKEEINTKRLEKDSGFVLFCDDDKNIRNVSEKMLEYLGYTPIIARDGLEAVNAYRERRDDIILIILDLTMPFMTGNEVLEKIRLISNEVPIIMSSGYNETEVAYLFKDSPNVSFLQKPYTLKVLQEKIRSFLN
jgi:PAS domain S-box-containing protein